MLTALCNGETSLLHSNGRFPIQMTFPLQSKPGGMQPIGKTAGDGC